MNEPVPGETLWTLTKDGHTYVCQLFYDVGHGVAVEIIDDGRPRMGRRFQEKIRRPRGRKKNERSCRSTDVSTVDTPARRMPLDALSPAGRIGGDSAPRSPLTIAR